ncbi:MAG: hypothetical protein PHI34_06615 [Acidobacteriota bacterium]|nr:hypothetical protein [Acidobacteriota bacterium]
MPHKSRETAFALLVTLLFLAAAGFVISRHEIWRDEAQAWLIAKDSRSLDDLALRIKFDGHAATWYWGLFLLSRFTSSPLAMQIWHLLLAAGAVFLFARFAPFPRAARLLFAFSYYAFYEYGVIARNYAIGVLALFLFCAAWKHRRRSLLLPAASILLLAQTISTMYVLAVALTIVLAGECILRRRAERPRFLIFAAVVVLIGLGIGLYQSIPDSASIFSKSLSTEMQVDRAYYIFRLIGKTCLALPDPGPHFWGSSILTRFASAPITTPLFSALFVLFALAALFDRPRALAFYVMSTGALCVFYYAAYLGYIRHHGALFLAFLAALWLSADEKPLRLPGTFLRGAAGWARRAVPAVLVAVLAVQTAGTAVAVRYEIELPFSQGKRVAQYIREQGLTDWVLVGDIYYSLAPICAYLDRPIYQPFHERWGSYALWTRPDHLNRGMSQIQDEAERLSRETGKEYLLILSYHLDRDSLATRHLRPVAFFGGSIVMDESYYLYRRDKRTLGVRS